MPITPGRRPITTGEDAVMIASDQRPAGRRRDGAAGVGDFLLQLAESGDPGDGGVTGEPPNCLGRKSPAPLDLADGRALDAGERVDGGLDDQLRPRPGPTGLAATVGMARPAVN